MIEAIFLLSILVSGWIGWVLRGSRRPIIRQGQVFDLWVGGRRPTEGRLYRKLIITEMTDSMHRGLTFSGADVASQIKRSSA